MRALLIRGMVSGFVAGAGAVVVARWAGQGPLSAGLAFEAAQRPRAAAEPEVLSRSVQATVGLATATLVFTVALGGLYGLVCGLAQGRLGGLSARATAAVVAGGGFLAVYLLPALKYPPNPPGVSAAATIGDRTSSYFALLMLCVAVVVGATAVAGRLGVSHDRWNASLGCGGAAAAMVGIAYWLLPAAASTPSGFDADVLWDFRMASGAVALTVWLVLGLVFGALTDRRLHRDRVAVPPMRQ
jgi:hypothetical protein